MIRKIILSVALLLSAVASAQTTTPVLDDVTIQMYTNIGTQVSRFVRTDKTGPLQLLMFGQDPTPGAPVGQVRPQRRLLGPSIVCGTAFDSTCDVVATAVTITSSQINDATVTGRGLLTAADPATARSTIGAPSASDLSAGLMGKANTVHTHVLVDVTDTTPTGRALASTASASAARGTLGLGTAALSNTPASGNAAGADVVIATDTRLTDARAPLAHTQAASTISDSTTAGRTLLTAADFAAQRSALSVLSASESNAAFYPLGSNPASYITRAGISVTGNGSYNSSTGVITVNGYTPPARVYGNPARTLGASFQISATRDAQVSYSLGVEVAGLLSVTAVKSIGFLEYADDAAMTTNLVLVDTGRSGAGGLINLANSGTIKLVGGIPAGKYARVRVTNTGSPTVTFDSVQEVQQ